jgi:hypothetical protein
VSQSQRETADRDGCVCGYYVLVLLLTVDGLRVESFHLSHEYDVGERFWRV